MHPRHMNLWLTSNSVRRFPRSKPTEVKTLMPQMEESCLGRARTTSAVRCFAGPCGVMVWTSSRAAAVRVCRKGRSGWTGLCDRWMEKRHVRSIGRPGQNEPNRLAVDGIWTESKKREGKTWTSWKTAVKRHVTRRFGTSSLGFPCSPLAMCNIVKLPFVAGAELPNRYVVAS